jgi:hypothetical protein
MSSKPQENDARRSHGWALVALALVAGALGAREARADIQVHVMLCTANAIEIQSYDSKDSVKAIAATTKKLSSAGASATLSCAGEGKGYCQMEIAITEKPVACAKADSSSGICGSASFHLDSGKWAVVTGFEESGNTCKPVYKVNQDSSSCN